MTGFAVPLLIAAAVLLLPGPPRTRIPTAPSVSTRSVSLLWRRPRPAEPSSEIGGLLSFLDVVAPGLRAGRTPEEAVRLACDVVRGNALVDQIGAAVAAGRSVESVLDRESTRPEVRLFARAWGLSVRTGCPLADAVECAARVVRARSEHTRRIETASAGARTTIRILTLLPLGGPLLAVAVGVDPVDAYVTSPTAWACLAVGAVLVVLGHVWVDRLVEAVGRGPVLG